MIGAAVIDGEDIATAVHGIEGLVEVRPVRLTQRDAAGGGGHDEPEREPRRADQAFGFHIAREDRLRLVARGGIVTEQE